MQLYYAEESDHEDLASSSSSIAGTNLRNPALGPSHEEVLQLANSLQPDTAGEPESCNPASPTPETSPDNAGKESPHLTDEAAPDLGKGGCSEEDGGPSSCHTLEIASERPATSRPAEVQATRGDEFAADLDEHKTNPQGQGAASLKAEPPAIQDISAEGPTGVLKATPLPSSNNPAQSQRKSVVFPEELAAECYRADTSSGTGNGTQSSFDKNSEASSYRHQDGGVEASPGAHPIPETQEQKPGPSQNWGTVSNGQPQHENSSSVTPITEVATGDNTNSNREAEEAWDSSAANSDMIVDRLHTADEPRLHCVDEHHQMVIQDGVVARNDEGEMTGEHGPAAGSARRAAGEGHLEPADAKATVATQQCEDVEQPGARAEDQDARMQEPAASALAANRHEVNIESAGDNCGRTLQATERQADATEVEPKVAGELEQMTTKLACADEAETEARESRGLRQVSSATPGGAITSLHGQQPVEAETDRRAASASRRDVAAAAIEKAAGAVAHAPEAAHQTDVATDKAADAAARTPELAKPSIGRICKQHTPLGLICGAVS